MSDKWLEQWLATNLPDDVLDKLRSDVYDRWCWESMANSDRDLFDKLDVEARQRKMAAHNPNTLTFQGMQAGANVVLTEAPGGGTITISVDEDRLAKRVAEIIKNDPSL